MKNILLLIVLVFSGCQSYSVVNSNCDSPKMFVIQLNDGTETYPTAISQIETVKELNSGNIKAIVYFCSDEEIKNYLDARYPLIYLDNQVLK